MYPAELCNTLCGSIFIFTISFNHFIALYRAQFCAYCLHCSVGGWGGKGVEERRWGRLFCMVSASSYEDHHMMIIR